MIANIQDSPNCNQLLLQLLYDTKGCTTDYLFQNDVRIWGLQLVNFSPRNTQQQCFEDVSFLPIPLKKSPLFSSCWRSRTSERTDYG